MDYAQAQSEGTSIHVALRTDTEGVRPWAPKPARLIGAGEERVRLRDAHGAETWISQTAWCQERR